MANSNAEEMQLKRSLQLLQSSHANSAKELREILDRLIIQNGYGSMRTISKTVGKNWLSLETNFPGRAKTPEPEQEAPTPTAIVGQTDEIISLLNSPARTISDSADSNDSIEGVSSTVCLTTDALISNVDDDVNMKEDFADLNCCVCGNMMFTATNKLVECSACHALYHQECHKPAISDENASEKNQHNWLCEACLSKPSNSSKSIPSASTPPATAVIVIPDDPVPLITISKSKTSATSSRSSSSSSSSLHKHEQQNVASSSSGSSKHHRNSKEHRSKGSSSGNSSTVITPAINVLSAADKGSSSGKRSSVSNTAMSTSKSSSRSAKHHKGSSSGSNISNRRKSCK